MKERGFTTKVIHEQYLKKDAHNALQMPVYSNVAFEFDTAEQMESAFQGRQPDHMYSRISNPTVENLEQRIKAITGALAVTALSSGMAAIANVFLTIAKTGDNIITSKHLFGNTISFFEHTLKPFGFEIRYCDLNNSVEIENHIDSKTIGIYFETITNPLLEVADISKLSEIAVKRKILLIADSTMTPSNIFNAKKFGVNLEVISGTKLISGGATSMGGLIIDHGNYNWGNLEKFNSLSKKFGPYAFNLKLRREVFRNIGACMSPFNAYLHSLGLETLELRYNKSANNTIGIAEYLLTNNMVSKVNFPGLKDSPYFETSRKQFGETPCSILSFNLGSKEKSFAFLDKLQIIRRATNLYDNKSLAIHPASTIFNEYSEEQRNEMGVTDDLIRLSVGIEDLNDLIEDIDNALI